MAHHKTTAKANIITVRDANNTYTARWDGEKASCTAGPEQAARACAAKMLDIEAGTVVLEKLPAEKERQYRYKVAA